MTLRLILMRHAKSSWKSDAVTDHARPLNGRGRRDCPKMGEALRDRGWWPDLVVASDAERTQETWRRMADGAEGPRVQLERTLYLGGVRALREVVGQLPGDVQTVLLLGHNPGWEEALEWLSGESERMTTATAALLEVEAKGWAEAVAEPESFGLVDLLRPKQIAAPA